MADKPQITARLVPPHDNYVEPPEGVKDEIIFLSSTQILVRCAHFMLKTPIPAEPIERDLRPSESATTGDGPKMTATLVPPHDNYVEPPDGAKDEIIFLGPTQILVRCAHFMLKTPIPAKPLEEERGW